MIKLLNKILELPIMERLELVEEIMLGICADYDELSPSEKIEIDLRSQALEQNKVASNSLGEVLEEFNKRNDLDN